MAYAIITLTYFLINSDLVKAVTSDGHDKPFCTKAITIVDNFIKALGDIDKSQFLKSINFSDKCCGKFSMCLTKFFCKSNCKNVFSRFF